MYGDLCGSAALRMLPVLENDMKIFYSVFSCIFFLSLQVVRTHNTSHSLQLQGLSKNA